MKKCSQHQDFDLDILCLDCNVIICKSCLNHHNKHTIKNINEIKQSLLNINYNITYSNDDVDDSDDSDDNDDNNKNENNNNNNNSTKENNVFQERLQWLWNQVKVSTEQIEELTSHEDRITEQFQMYFEMLMLEERRLKKPIVDEIDNVKQHLDNYIKEIQSLYNIIQQQIKQTSTKVVEEVEEDHKQIEKEIKEDITINYELPAIIESLEQSESLDQFIHHNSNTIFYVNKQISKNDNNFNNNNDNNDNHNECTILDIIENHNIQYKKKNSELEIVDYDVMTNDERYQYTVRNYILESIVVQCCRTEEQRAANPKHSFFVQMSSDNKPVLSLLPKDEDGVLQSMKTESDMIASCLDQVKPTSVHLVASKHTIYMLHSERGKKGEAKIIAYSPTTKILDDCYLTDIYRMPCHVTMLNPVMWYDCYSNYIYLYGKSSLGITHARINTLNYVYEDLLLLEDPLNVLPIGIYTDYHSSGLFTLLYNSQFKSFKLKEYFIVGMIGQIDHTIAKNIVPTFISQGYYDKAIYLYIGANPNHKFLKIDISNFPDVDPTTKELKTIDPNENVKALLNNRLLLTPMAFDNDNKEIYLFTENQCFVYSIKENVWRKWKHQPSHGKLLVFSDFKI
ncbi:hypothetical protein PPL_01880 [Heterostelium album PN500]|uniref:B box-type domain-containing protein n=1 Tax=Heterostelium pallidum (strain ATCC 26659 / Pp 5 / PN500) TaxID=670386 RepID=D3B0R3_HETP5|nr:hypothetical protein PPL_01880 [Heterostelium album PN500]EFA84887.1 hypothetical protein PPL_01880 [Heterostelium album PN500]|eukprot:XP_020436998.1 hypothetical protein PPL_01880 [Heterostelium album PN500]